MKMWNKCICLTSRKTLIVLATLLISTLMLAAVRSEKEPTEPIGPVEQPEEIINEEVEIWIPTEEDIAYQDSMYTIIQSPQNDINDSKQDIVYIIERLDYPDGTYDSIRYVKGGEIDKRRN